ncbi:hypothetical protein [Aureimonas leprariae]|uniref:Quinol:cytochrome c oxidoreductase quinone-binding subunit 2 n=1 Tax=Plantimonas leprariae TaxID=2615207 RepID=A0A7V7PTB6_9HYPH|nr:hypothetical protein [Aureimonas leprariae]KAB0682974.1 hypothetical protein F6X38_02540 [Aureimonas leprariae]
MSRRLALDRRWLGLLAAGLLLLIAIFDAHAAARGLLAGFLLLVAVPAGSMLLFLIHRLTGGRWGAALEPVLRPAAALLPAVALLMVPVLLLPHLVYPWAADPSTIRHADVAALYFNAPSFALRSVAALGVWGFFASLVAFRPARLTVPLAGVGLALFGLTVSFAAVDFVIALDPRFKSTAFAMSLSVSFLLAGAGFAAATGAPSQARADLAKLLAALALGLLYLDLMQFLVAYDGNLPDQAAWYLRRATPLGVATLGLASIGAVAAPFLAVMRSGWRGSAAIQRAVGFAVLAGTALRTLWWTVPELAPSPLFWLAVALTPLVVAGLAAWIAFAMNRGVGVERRVAHGA